MYFKIPKPKCNEKLRIKLESQSFKFVFKVSIKSFELVLQILTLSNHFDV